MKSDLDQLIEAARGHRARPTSQQRERVKQGVAAVVALSAGGVSAATVIQLVTATVVAAAVGSGATLAVLHARRGDAPSASAPGVAVARRVAPVVIAPVVSAPPLVEAQPAVAPVTRAPERPVAAPPAAPSKLREDPPRLETPPVSAEGPSGPVAPAPSSPLSVELSLLRQAAEAFDAHDYQRAERALTRYDAQPGTGALATEAGVLRVLVWCELEKGDDARALAAKLVDADPHSPVLQRLRASCARAILP